jgi:preprotein translocase subunit SecA
MLPIIDRQWVDHLYVMDHLKTGIGLRGYGQKDPRVEYEKEAFEIFESLKNNIADEAIKGAFRVVIEHSPPPEMQQAVPAGHQFEAIPSGDLSPQAAPQGRLAPQHVEQLLGPMPGSERRPSQLHTNKDDESPAKPVQRGEAKVGRNDMCPCGSGKKYKKCHGTAA